MPQFVYVELPSFRIKDSSGHTMNMSYRHLGLVEALYHFVRGGLQTTNYVDLSAAILFAGGETDTWAATNTLQGHHAEENLLLTYFQTFDSPGAYPIIDALLLSNKPCNSCIEYFALTGKQLRPRDGSPPFRAKFTPRSDRSYTPVFYLSRSLDAGSRSGLWMQLAQMWASEFGDTIKSSPDVARGQMYYILNDSPWYALNDQENLNDAEVAEAISRQDINPMYWIGR
ncbi:Uu.00g061930.m01.CDS01 [Anthostomella pinea]|uniref:Uu.00g061930.m01.CDS01 n=1 Tax=Anthostomella pinea TaxID=933095 RepID=A0AAI8YMG9_9PEZI|nr:Uu.00g061930.m01.CDS01 [Anthostomella pinea]